VRCHPRILISDGSCIAVGQDTGGQGWAQRALAVFVTLGIVALALRVRHLATAPATKPARVPR
jgi:hypothetical protein